VLQQGGRLTNGDGLDLHAFFNVRRVGVIRVLVLEDLLSAEGVHKGCPACLRHGQDDHVDGDGIGVRTSPRGAADHQAELDSLLDILLPARLEHLESC
jgi:hypothetical protein